MDITVAADFSKSDYMAVEARISAYLGGLGVDAATVPGFSGYAGGWNALIMRFRAADEEHLVASSSLAQNQSGLSQEDRYLQEKALFGFVANAMCAVESCCFTIYHLGRMKQPALFTASARDVNVGVTSAAVATAFPGTPLHAELCALTVDTEWLKLKKIRNTLVHRESPGITIYMSTTGSPPPPPVEWTGRGVALEPALVDVPRAWLGAVVTRLVGATLTFVGNNF